MDCWWNAGAFRADLAFDLVQRPGVALLVNEKPEDRPVKSSELPGLLWTTLLVHGR
jgi:hypothetical protein